MLRVVAGAAERRHPSLVETSGNGALKRASQLFVFDESKLDSPFIEKIWRTRGQPAASFISVAVSRWQIVVTRQDRGAYVTVRGPETRASVVPIPDDAEFFGIQFKPGTFMPHLPACRLVDGAVDLPAASRTSFRLDGAAWDFPNYDDAGAFVARLLREDLLARDQNVDEAARGRANGDLSPRSLQRRFLRATGLTQETFRQIERAQHAAELLDGGASIRETVAQAGYVDQPHLTRALRRFAGQTPAQIARPTGA